MDPRNDQVSEERTPVEPEEIEPEPIERVVNDREAPASEPAPIVPEIVPADTPLQGEALTADFSTVGTGTVFAVSCSFLAVLFIVVCVGFFILFRVF